MKSSDIYTQIYFKDKHEQIHGDIAYDKKE